MAASPSQLPLPTPQEKKKKLPRSVPSKSHEEEVNLYLKIIKTVALKVRRNSTLKHIKATIKDKEQIDERSQKLFFEGHHLEDGKRLVDYGIHGDSTLHLILKDSTRIAVKVEISSTRKSLLVAATRLDTVRNVKSMIQAKEGIRLDEFALVFSGKVLAEGRTLASLDLPPEPTFHLFFHPKDDVSVTVYTSSLAVTLSAKSWYTVRDLKAIAGGLMSAQVMSLHIIHQGMQLEDHKTLACYNIANNSFLLLVSCDDSIKIFVKCWDGKTVVLQVFRYATVEEVKKKLLEKLQVRAPPERLQISYEGKRLADNLNLASYGIQHYSTLFQIVLPLSK